MRAFVGIPLGPATVAALLRVQARLPVGRPVPEDNLHLTLAFLDEQPEAALEALHVEMEALRHPGFDLRFSGYDSFGGDRPRLVYAAVAPDPALAGLHRAVLRAARAAGIVLAERRFRPHVTLARFGAGLRGDGVARLAGFLAHAPDVPIPDSPARAVTLWQSTLRPDGARHDPLAHYPLAMP